MSDRGYVVHLTSGEAVDPDIVKVKESGWLYCCWTDGDSSKQRTYPPHAVQYYDSLPAEDGE